MKYIGICILMLGSARLFGQSPDSLLVLANKHNPDLHAGLMFYEALLERQTQARQWPEPEANLSFVALPFPNRTGLPDATVGWMQPIPWKGMPKLKGDIALIEARVALEEVALQRLDIQFRIREAYWNLFALEQQAGIIRENVELLRALERLAQTKMELGTGSLTDVLDIQIRILELEQQVQQIINAKRNPLAEINQLLGRPITEPIEIQAIKNLVSIALQPDSLVQQVLNVYPGLSVVRYNQEASRQRQALNNLEAKPGLVVGLDYALMRKGEDMPSNGRDMWMPRIGVRVPLFREFYVARDREEKLVQAAWEARKKVLENSLSASIEQALAKLEEARLKYTLVQNQRPLLEAAIRTLREEYGVDGTGLASLLRYDEVYLGLKLAEIEAIAASNRAVAALMRFLK